MVNHKLSYFYFTILAVSNVSLACALLRCILEMALECIVGWVTVDTFLSSLRKPK